MAYLVTLTRAVAKHKAAGTQGDAVARAEALLAEMAKAVPNFPHNEQEDRAVRQLNTWRARMAKLIMALR